MFKIKGFIGDEAFYLRAEDPSSQWRLGGGPAALVKYSRVLALALVLFGAASSVGSARDDGAFAQFMATYRCPVADRLFQLYADGKIESTRNRFLAVKVPEHPHGYVQCIFANATNLHCEAASGYYRYQEGQESYRLPADSETALRDLGFKGDGDSGNYSHDFPIGGAADLVPAAELILRALFDGYGARVTTALRFNAPLAPAETSLCIPSS